MESCPTVILQAPGHEPVRQPVPGRLRGDAEGKGREALRLSAGAPFKPNKQLDRHHTNQSFLGSVPSWRERSCSIAEAHASMAVVALRKRAKRCCRSLSCM